MPPDLGNPAFQLHLLLDPNNLRDGSAAYSAPHSGLVIRLHIDPGGIDPPAVLLPFDQLFEQRVRAALVTWRALTGRRAGPNPATLSASRRDRLVLALRALDGRLEGASYLEIAAALFGAPATSGRAWKTHDARDRTIRLARYGMRLMRGDYRNLLLHPYRGRP